jgi:hypothetical protein
MNAGEFGRIVLIGEGIGMGAALLHHGNHWGALIVIWAAVTGGRLFSVICDVMDTRAKRRRGSRK